MLKSNNNKKKEQQEGKKREPKPKPPGKWQKGSPFYGYRQTLDYVLWLGAPKPAATLNKDIQN